ncbi:MAG: hypothetical protein DRI57_23515 [Deltaproteobacteria bacterium]|nr:MAG: hypothetical protein DRI57_23515 [Deltaproteobacteria bacterium]
MESQQILIIEDDTNSSKVLARILEKKGYVTDYVPSGEEGLAMLSKTDYDLLLIDMVLPGMDGLSLLKEVRKTHPDILSIIVTAYGSITSAVESLKAGANDFLEKPVIPEKLLHVLRKAFEERRLRKEIVALRSDLAQRYQFANIVGKHPKMQQIFQLIESVAVTDSSVLITGETGTGKDLVARAIHFQSSRQHKPFIAINCASVPETLLESELFGFERGAFTGAVSRKIGKLEQAQGGTVFLDEIGDMPMAVQGKLLRAIQERKIERLGSVRHTPISLDIRLISATNRDLPLEITDNRFRLDLFYRLNVVPIRIPPLRERPEDIPLLMDHLLDKLVREKNRPRPRISEKVLSQLLAHSWPGNVRELENVLERSLILNQEQTISNVLFSQVVHLSRTSEELSPLITDPQLSLKAVREHAIVRLEREYLSILLRKYKGSIKRTAAHADIDARTIRRKMKAYGLDKWDFKEI